MDKRALWERYKKQLCVCEPIGLTLDVSRMNFSDDFFAKMSEPMARAFEAMDALEKGAIANPDEQRMVGHYWLRAPDLAPAEEKKAVKKTLADIHSFASAVHSGKVRTPKRKKFQNVLVVGIGGSALGPQFVAEALGSGDDRMRPFFFDNTDPQGMDRTLERIGAGLDQTLTVVISKSGGTKETRNGMLEAERVYRAKKLDFGKFAVAVTGEGSDLDHHAEAQGWLCRFPMWDWVGGRTSELSAVGLLPASLQGIDIDSILRGARDTDKITRVHDVAKNPSALMALMWHHAGGGRGAKDLVLLPYKDRLLLFSKYLQQLLMESLGKEFDLAGKLVNQGIAVYGNKGSTDQHAYVQQLRDGVHNFFVTFVQVLKDRDGKSMQVEEDTTSGDFLLGFLLGTRGALYEKDRQSMTISIGEVTPYTIGVLIALFERAVGFYGTLVNINAYHQPGVEAGKKAAASVLAVQKKLLAALRAKRRSARTAEELAREIGSEEDVEIVFKVLQHLAANPDHGVKQVGKGVLGARYASA